ncbi:MAG: 5-bromo-4-chloroindolyl phosphate hydrolysis family protein [Oscillospiraceae bacterium]|nr:5-bromo-4-chloroindolyl phosphate hydrolysis family protein [Oscillospiraceae bacterium]
MYNRRRKRPSGPFYTFAIVWLILSGIIPIYELWGLLMTAGICLSAAFLFGRITASAAQKKEAEPKRASAPQASGVRKTDPGGTSVRKTEYASAPAAPAPAPAPSPAKKSYGPEIDPIVEEGNRALSEMGRLYLSIKDPEVRGKINEIMRITDKITQDAIEDPSDIPQIKKFMNYYLPTTIKLLNAYDRMSAQGIEGENLNKSMNSINEMLDAAIVAYKKRLDSLFANQALDIETDISVMNTMLAREGLSGEKDFIIEEENKGEVAQAN